MSGSTRWVSVVLAHSHAEAEMWKEMLAEEGIVAMIRPSDASVYLGANTFAYVMAPEEMGEHAKELVEAWTAESALDETDPDAPWNTVTADQDTEAQSGEISPDDSSLVMKDPIA